MLKGILAGLVAGALATAGVLKAVATHRSGAAAEKAEAPAAAAQDPAALKAQAEALKTGNEELRGSLEKKKGELASAEEKPDGGGKKKKKKAGEKTWKELAPLLVKAFAARGGEDRDSKEAQAAQLDFMALIARIAKERGVSMDEAMSLPEGMPALLRALLETGDPPGTPEQLAQVDALLEKYTRDWENLRKDDAGLSRLERRIAVSEMADGYLEGVLGAMTDEQKGNSQNFEMFSGMTDGMGGNSHYTNGTREAVSANLTDAWAKALKFDESQRSQLGPFIDAYMKDYEDAQEKFRDGAQPGDRTVWKKIQREQIRAQIKAQQAMASAMSLTPAQQKALRDWGTTYQFWVDTRPKSGDPEEPPPPGDE